MFFNEHRILANIGILENDGSEGLLAQSFIYNHNTLKLGMIGVTLGFLMLIATAVFKPWMHRERKGGLRDVIGGVK